MKKTFVVILLGIIACACNRQTFDNSKISSSLSLNDSRIFLGNIEDDKLAVFLSSTTASSVSGHSFIIDGNENDTVAFHLNLNGSNVEFEQIGKSKKYRIVELNVDKNEISGIIRSGLFSKKKFCFKPHNMPIFKEFDSQRYNEALFDVDTISNVKYGTVNGYWTSSGYDYDINMILKMQGKTLTQQKLDLTMDVYLPQNDTLKKRPLIMFIHGGAFYVGCKEDLPMQGWCSHYASLGYVTVSIDYRMGFLPFKRNIERAGYAAIQDAHAAMRYLVENQSVYGIDTSMMFVGGTSAGAITALHLAFMTNETRPETSYNGMFDDNMGDIEHSGNLLNNTFSIKGVVDMWGAVCNIEMIDSKKIPVAAFHGDLDEMVPYGYDYPFTMIGPGCKLLFNKMYGSSTIVERLLQNGIDKSKMYTLYNMHHSPHVDEGRELNEIFYYIQDCMDPFFKDITANPETTTDGNSFFINDINATDITWQVDGGIILKSSGNGINVAWFGNAPEHKVYASGLMRGTGFLSEFNVNKK